MNATTVAALEIKLAIENFLANKHANISLRDILAGATEYLALEDAASDFHSEIRNTARREVQASIALYLAEAPRSLELGKEILLAVRDYIRAAISN